MTDRTALTVEDDAAIRRGVADALRFADFQVTEAANGTDGMALALQRRYDILLLDLVLPGPSGLDILSEVRRQRPTQPVIILTARGEENDRVEGLRLGADDYVVKPFSVKELLARVEAVLRRSPERPTDVAEVELPGLTIDLERREIRFNGHKHNGDQRVDLSEREVELLRYLVSNAGRAIARDEILERVWQISPHGISTRTIDMHVARLREKLRDDPAKPRVLITVRGKGYMFASAEKVQSNDHL